MIRFLEDWSIRGQLLIEFHFIEQHDYNYYVKKIIQIINGQILIFSYFVFWRSRHLGSDQLCFSIFLFCSSGSSLEEVALVWSFSWEHSFYLLVVEELLLILDSMNCTWNRKLEELWGGGDKNLPVMEWEKLHMIRHVEK